MTSLIVIAGLMILASIILDKFLTPWMVKRSANKMLTDIKSGKPPKPPDYHFEIIFDDTSFSVASLKKLKPERLSTKWSDVQKVVAFKRDLGMVDQVCLFLSQADGTGIELDEEMKGWSEFIDVLPRFLPSCKVWEEWFMGVASPAFATNLTELYNRANHPTKISI